MNANNRPALKIEERQQIAANRNARMKALRMAGLPDDAEALAEELLSRIPADHIDGLPACGYFYNGDPFDLEPADEAHDEAHDETSEPAEPIRATAGGGFNPTEFALEILEELAVDDVPTLFWSAGSWYQWEQNETGTHWQLLDKADITNLIALALRNRIGIAKVKTIADVLVNLQANAAIRQTAPMPFWTDGTSAGQYIAVRNGVLDLDAAIRGDADPLRPHTPHWRSLSCLPYDYDPAATWTELKTVLMANLDGDRERYAIMQEWAGYMLTSPSEHDEQKFLLFQGRGGTGKSTALGIYRQLVGAKNCSAVSLHDFGDKFKLFDIHGKLANIAGDMREISSADEEKIKMLTGGDLIQLEAKYKATISCMNTARLIFACNDLPTWRDREGAISRREILLTLDRVIERPDRKYGRPNYWTESGLMPGVLNWAIEGLRRLREQGRFTHSERVAQDVANHARESNPAQRFLEENCMAMPGGRIKKQALYTAYREWAIPNGHNKLLASNKFGLEVRKVFPDVEEAQLRMNGERDRFYVGIVFSDHRLPAIHGVRPTFGRRAPDAAPEADDIHADA